MKNTYIDIIKDILCRMECAAKEGNQEDFYYFKLILEFTLSTVKDIDYTTYFKYLKYLNIAFEKFTYFKFFRIE